MTLIKMTSPLHIKQLNEEGLFEGYASVFQYLDDQGDRVMKGAFSDSLRTWDHLGQAPKMLWQHDPTEPIGKWEKVQEDDYGLRVKGRLLLDLQRGRKAYTILKADVLDSLSIGYRIIEARPGQKGSERLLSKLDLHEISLVTFPANAQAKITQVKHRDQSDHAMLQKMQALIALMRS